MPSLIQENVSLKAFNSFGFDVTARYFAELTSMDQIESVLALPGITGWHCWLLVAVVILC